MKLSKEQLENMVQELLSPLSRKGEHDHRLLLTLICKYALEDYVKITKALRGINDYLCSDIEKYVSDKIEEFHFIGSDYNTYDEFIKIIKDNNYKSYQFINKSNFKDSDANRRDLYQLVQAKYLLKDLVKQHACDKDNEVLKLKIEGVRFVVLVQMSNWTITSSGRNDLEHEILAVAIENKQLADKDRLFTHGKGRKRIKDRRFTNYEGIVVKKPTHNTLKYLVHKSERDMYHSALYSELDQNSSSPWVKLMKDQEQVYVNGISTWALLLPNVMEYLCVKDDKYKHVLSGISLDIFLVSGYIICGVNGGHSLYEYFMGMAVSSNNSIFKQSLIKEGVFEKVQSSRSFKRAWKYFIRKQLSSWPIFKGFLVRKHFSINLNDEIEYSSDIGSDIEIEENQEILQTDFHRLFGDEYKSESESGEEDSSSESSEDDLMLDFGARKRYLRKFQKEYPKYLGEKFKTVKKQSTDFEKSIDELMYPNNEGELIRTVLEHKSFNNLKKLSDYIIKHGYFDFKNAEIPINFEEYPKFSTNEIVQDWEVRLENQRRKEQRKAGELAKKRDLDKKSSALKKNEMSLRKSIERKAKKDFLERKSKLEEDRQERMKRMDKTQKVCGISKCTIF
ncbi:hypothetical protein LO80_07380 [Candidatus Francisella endociliophora]|uniref:Uncharacterized protein n=1 Tax=Candidatus Francisella endociliophora TaxID=653937 RepID=A0A097EQF9_9GAMM|nr:hypothetical protein [Francisella sp. FSC1006]AIT09805.1 hypothetical protein LO80_07380 [Francisella sp. FSC1006]